MPKQRITGETPEVCSDKREPIVIDNVVMIAVVGIICSKISYIRGNDDDFDIVGNNISFLWPLSWSLKVLPCAHCSLSNL